MTDFLLRSLTWAVLRAWSQNYPQVVGTCPGHHLQPIAQNRVERPEPPSNHNRSIVMLRQDYKLATLVNLNQPSRVKITNLNKGAYGSARVVGCALSQSTKPIHYIWAQPWCDRSHGDTPKNISFLNSSMLNHTFYLLNQQLSLTLLRVLRESSPLAHLQGFVFYSFAGSFDGECTSDTTTPHAD